MRVLLMSTYELGHQPIHVASPARRLLDAGHEVRALDTSVEEWDEELVDWAQMVGISVPMHTAMRLGVAAARRIRKDGRDPPIAAYGLYAGVGRDSLVPDVFDTALVGEYEGALLDWLDDPGRKGVRVELGRSSFGVPARHLLPPPDRYARAVIDGQERVAAAVEASHGCRHRCKHCPIPAVYDGRYRITGSDVVVGDVEQLVEMGVSHITWSDPDFLNAPRYAMDVLGAVHERHPHLTHDLTVKVEHIVKHRGLWDGIRQLGVRFVVSAFESVDDETLLRLDKGHRVADMVDAISVLRAADIEPRPSWLPFTPWTTTSHIADMFDFVIDRDLVAVSDPVQLSIRLLVPDGSLLEDDAAMTGYDAANLTWIWGSADPEVDLLQTELAAIASRDADEGVEPLATLRSMGEAVTVATGTEFVFPDHLDPAPGLTEPWFCCAEPTDFQTTGVGLVGDPTSI